jgi:hypothetical protein
MIGLGLIKITTVNGISRDLKNQNNRSMTRFSQKDLKKSFETNSMAKHPTKR